MRDHEKATTTGVSETPPDRLYIVTRADLPVGLQAAQCAHAAFAFAERYPRETAEWMLLSNFIVLVACPDEQSLKALALTAMRADIPVALNYEPDEGGALTAIVLGPGPDSKRLCRDLPLVGAVPVGT